MWQGGRATVTPPCMLQQAQVRAYDQTSRGQQQGDTERVANEVFHLLPSAQRACDEYTTEGPWDGADAEPFDQAEMNGPASQVDE